MNKNSTSQSQLLIRELRNLFGHFSIHRRWQLTALLFVMLAGAVAELATLGAVLPFLAILVDPTLAEKYALIQKIFVLIEWNTHQNILLPATILFGVVAFFASGVRIFLLWFSNKIIFGLGGDIAVEVYRRMLHQPYSFHVSHNSGEIIASISKVQLIISNVITPLVQGCVSLLLSVAILGALIAIDPITATVAGIGFLVIYLLITVSTRNQLHINSKVIADNETRRIQAVQEGLGGIRDILIDSTQDVYISRFWEIDTAQRNAQAANMFIATAPRYLIESMSMILIAVLAYWLSLRSGGLTAAIPILGALAIGAQKLMPQMQQLYYGWAALSGSQVILRDVLLLLNQSIPDEYTNSAEKRAIHFDKGLVLHDVCFRYRNDTPIVLQNINIKIPRGSRVGFIGKTGSGKSTLIDLIMGLLDVTSGKIEIDGELLTNATRRAWQARIAHVPQAIYLADTSIAQNIAFGIDAREIDEIKVRNAAAQAQLAEFIEILPEQYKTIIGERGVRLSGGQRQRIGLARALYKQADIIIFDEATSALDDVTEKAVMQEIDSLEKNITVLMIAHRISTLSGCDYIFELRNGSLINEKNSKEIF